MNLSYITLKGSYRAQWDKMAIDPSREPQIKAAATKIISHKDVYTKLQGETGVPWYFIGLLHYRESDCNFHTHLHNGDSLARRTVQVPAGRPRVANPGEPPFTFDHSAQDALQYEGYTSQTDWSLEQIAYRLEGYNGWGYRQYGCPSPYLWAGTNDYSRGKFVADHVFDGTYVDTQLGCMPILKEIITSEGINLDAPQVVVAPQAGPVPISPKADLPRPTSQELNKQSRKHWWNSVMQQIMALFGLGGASLQGLNMAQLQQTKTTLDFLKDFSGSYGLIAVITISLLLVMYFMYQNKLIKDDAEEGRYTPSTPTTVAVTTTETPNPTESVATTVTKSV